MKKAKGRGVIRPVGCVVDFVAAAAVTVLPGCRSCPQCPEVSQAETVVSSEADMSLDIRWRVDSVSVRDSVVAYMAGDTLRVREFHFRDRIRIHTDTMTRHRIVNRYHTRTVTVTKTVQASRPLWLRIVAAVGFLSLASVIVYILKKTFPLLRKLMIR